VKKSWLILSTFTLGNPSRKGNLKPSTFLEVPNDLDIALPFVAPAGPVYNKSRVRH